MYTAFVELSFAELDTHADVSCKNVRIWPALKKKLHILPCQCCSDMIKIHNTRHNARHNSNLIVKLKELNCTGYRCTTAHCTLGQTVEKPQELSGKICTREVPRAQSSSSFRILSWERLGWKY